MFTKWENKKNCKKELNYIDSLIVLVDKLLSNCISHLNKAVMQMELKLHLQLRIERKDINIFITASITN